MKTRKAYIGKRLFDLVLAAVALIVLSPLLVFIAALVRIKLGRPVLFRQERPGLHGRLFTIYKFRTMSDDWDAQGNLLPDNERLMGFGGFLRATSMDELPELFNVLKGDMSIVGPRPLLMEYLPLYSEFQHRRHEVRPGITGWAQVMGRNTLSWEEKFWLDVWYVENRSFRMDLKILFLTIRSVLKQEGIHHPGHVTMTKFRGKSGREQQ